METQTMTTTQSSGVDNEANDQLLNELVSHLRSNRKDLTEAWVTRVTLEKLLSVMTSEEISSELTAVYD
ncbi:MAG: anti-anti-sigma factor, partial [Actinomycetota bacterium]|nr:anti-anti-sigma factor [Actinomycetota bacterium]